jgi:proline iminopeptidase
VALIPEQERRNLIAAYHARLTCGDPAIETIAAQAWCGWEEEILTLEPQPAAPSPDNRMLLALARIETHYFMHRAFLKEGQLIRNAYRLHAIPAVIVQGRYDTVTPPVTAWDLHQAWPQADLQMVPDAGHASTEPGNLRRLIMATDGFAGT